MAGGGQGAALVDPSWCAVDAAGAQSWEAGKAAVLVVERKDAAGRRVAPRDAGAGGFPPLTATASGPGAVETAVVENEDGTARVSFTAKVAGTYSLSVFLGEARGFSLTSLFGTDDGRVLLPGAPFTAVCLAAPPSAAHCSVAVISGLREAPSGVLTATAGEQYALVLHAKDKCKNEATLSDGDTHASFSGVACGVLEQRARERGLVTLRTTASAAGAYLLHVTVRGEDLPGFPRLLHVEPARTDVSKCTIKGEGAAQAVVGSTTSVELVARDANGNARLKGGDQVKVVLRGPGDLVSVAQVTDKEDGHYRATFSLPVTGDWQIGLQVNGETARTVATLQCVRGAVEAGDCTIKTPPADDRRLEAGVRASIGLEVGPSAFQAGRRCNGTEAVKATVTAPSGLTLDLPPSALGDSSGFQLGGAWPEVGSHIVKATIEGQPVLGSPLVVNVFPQQLHLSACELIGMGSKSCVAGVRASFLLQACDARGNRITQGQGAVLASEQKLALEVELPDTQRVPGEVRDRGDGTFELFYTVELAGAVKLIISGGGATVVRDVTCEAGPTFVPRCKADSSELQELEAGSTGRMRILRFDKCGNAVPAKQGLPRFIVRAQGPGKLQTEALETGNGSVDVQVTATIVGQYSITVLSSDTQDELPGSPFMMTVMPGQASASSCVATISADGKPVKDNVVQAGSALEVKVEARDRFGNVTRFMRWQTVNVYTSGPEEVSFAARNTEESDSDAGALGPAASRFVARLSKAGGYIAWVMVGGQTVGDWPRGLQVVAGAAEANVVAGALATTMALRGAADPVSYDEDVMIVDLLQGENKTLRQQLLKYEAAARVVTDAAAARGVTLKDLGRDAAYEDYAKAQGPNPNIVEPAAAGESDGDDWSDADVSRL